MITEIGILLHEKPPGPGIFLSVVRGYTEENGWSLEALNIKRVERLTEVNPTLSVYNDPLAEDLIRQELEQVFSPEEMPKIIEAVRTISAVLGMPMRLPAVGEED